MRSPNALAFCFSLHCQTKEWTPMTVASRRRSPSPGDPTLFAAGASWRCLSQLWASLHVSRSFHPLLISCAGIIYSDIGTSPLYVLNGIWPANGPAPPKEDVIGGISAIVWAMALLPLLKYVSAHCPRFGDCSLTARVRSLSACISVPEKEKGEASPCFKGYIPLPVRTATATES